MQGTIKTGTYTGTGAAINIPLGFKPDFVRVFNITDGDAAWTWHKDMTDDTAIADAAGPVTLAASDGVSQYAGAIATTSEGFSVGAGMSESAKVFAYLAVRDS